MSTNQYLEQLASQLVLSDAEKQSISRSIATLQGHLYNWRHYCSVKIITILDLIVEIQYCQEPWIPILI